MDRMQVVVYMPKNRKIHIDNVEKIEDLIRSLRFTYIEGVTLRKVDIKKEEISNISINIFKLQ